MKLTHGMLLGALLTAALLLSGCGGAGSSYAAASAAGTEMKMQSASYGADEVSGAAAVASNSDSSAKRIYTASLEMETTGFDDASAGLTALVESCGGYFETSSVNSGGDGYRYGEYTVRVPAGKFQSFLNQAGKLCHVLTQTSSCEDVSEAYYDTQGRLTTQQTKLKRLQELLAKAEKMEDIITLESAISDTEQQIESLSGTLQHYDAQVNDASVQISLSEVYRLSNTEEPAESFGGRLSAALASGWHGFVGSVQSLLVALAYGWEWLALLAIVLGVGGAAVRRTRMQKKQASAPRQSPGSKQEPPKGGPGGV